MLKKLVCLLLFIASLASAYTLDGGGGVSWSNQYGTISQYPANLTDINNIVYLNITSNITGSISLDTAFDFNTSVIKPLDAQYWAFNVPHEVPTFGNITWETMCADSNDTCNYTKEVLNGTTIVYYDDWSDISNLFSKKSYNGDTFYILENIVWTKGQTRQLRATIQVNPNTKGKYNLYIKRSVDSWTDVINGAVPYVELDPWWDSSFLKRINLTISCPSPNCDNNVAMPFFFNNATIMNKMGVNGSSLRYVTECGAGNFTQRGLWIQKWNTGTNTSIWLNYTNITYCTHSIYYNSSVSSVSSPYNVFYKFDNFDASGVNTSMWACWNTACPRQLGNGWIEIALNSPVGAYGIFTNVNISLPWTAWVETMQRTTVGKETMFGSFLNGNVPASFYIDAIGAGTGNRTVNTYQPSLKGPYIGNGSLVTILDNNYLYEYTRASTKFNFSRQAVSNDELGGNTFTPYNETTNGTIYAGEWMPGYCGAVANENVSLFWTGVTLGGSIPSVTGYTNEETGGSPIVQTNVTLLNNTFGNIGTPYYNNPTALNASGNCTDPTSGPATYSGNFTFWKNGALYVSYMTYNWISGTINYTNTTITGTNLVKGDTWFVGLNCSNATVTNSEFTNSTTITVNNTRPTLTSPVITSSNGSYLTTSVFTCNNGTFSDADPSDSLNMSGYTPYRWHRNGTVISGQNNATLNLSVLAAVHTGENFSCEQTAYDIGYNPLNISQNSSNVTIGNNPTATIIAYDESTYTRIYFAVLISNSTTSNTSSNQYTFSQQMITLPSGTVSIFISNDTSYYPRTYYSIFDLSSNYSLSAYLLSTSANTISVNFYVETLNGQFISGATVLIEKQINGTYTTIGQMVTDASGIAHFWLDQTTAYRITATHPSYSTIQQPITPTLTSYAIYMTSANTTGTFESSWNDITWDFSPLGLLNGNYTQNFSFSSHSNNNSIVWTSWAIYNYSTLLHSDNQTGASGTSLTYSFKPGYNASIVVYFYIMHTNQSLQSLAQWWLPINSFFPNYILYRNLQQALGDIGTSGFLHPITIALIGIIVGVMVAGWVAQFSMSGGVVSFLSILGLTMYIGGAGAFISGATVLIAMLTVGAYYLWRSGG